MPLDWESAVVRRAYFNIWRAIFSFVAYWFLRSGLYKAKSDLYRFIWERRYAGTEIATYASVEDLASWIGKQNWRADGWKELWDAVSSPQKVQAVGQEKDGDHYIGDCDEFAIYLTAAIQKSIAQGVLKSRVANPRFFTVLWLEKDTWAPNGHNVCLLELPQADGTVLYTYMDYDLPHQPPRATPMDVAKAVVELYSGGHPYVPICWSMQEEDLTPEHTARW